MESENKVLLNSDGSGKALVKLKSAQAIGLGLGEAELVEAERNAAMGIVGAGVVDAWSDVTFSVNEEGFFEFRGVAYFPDFTRFPILGLFEGSDGASDGAIGWKMESAGGIITLTYSPNVDRSEPDGDPPPDTDEKIKEIRRQFNSGKETIEAMVGEMSSIVSIKVGGEITDTKGFERKGESVASVSINAEGVLKGIENMVMDDALLKKLAAKGQLVENPQGNPPPEFFECLYGVDELKIAFKAGDPLFDYGAEVAKAKANMPADLVKLIEDAKAAKKDREP